MPKRLSFAIRVFAAGLLLLSAFGAGAAPKDDFDPFTAGIEENISTPKVSARQQAKVTAAMAQLERTLKSAGFAVSRVRSGEVVLVTIPCSELFAPNATALKDTDKCRLSALVPYVKRADNYKVVVAVHTDNTGDATYADALTADRATAIDEFFYRHNSGADTGIIPYGIGSDEPVAPNTGVRNRASNRRVEIYFIPTSGFIEKVQKR
ncbi:MAG: OmpA family protein [Muribaculaceae bacterium]|nr:OmpA family protein [Muribaculaceae bacterium]